MSYPNVVIIMLKTVGTFFLLPVLCLLSLILCKPDRPERLTSNTLPADQDYEPVIVLELFTSQGCSSCPPADALLRSILQANSHKHVYGIAYHVDYWNYIGWEDPFSSLAYTEKQRVYSAKLGNNTIYTPQLVINGQEDVVGSDSGKIADLIGAYRKRPSENKLRLSDLRTEGQKIRVSYKVEGSFANKEIRGVLVLDERITEVKRGENRGRRLINNNIAIREETIPLKKEAGVLEIDIPELVRQGESMHLIALVENKEGHIMAADKVSLTFK